MKNKIISFFLTSMFSLLLSVSANAISLPGAGGGNTDEMKLKFTKIFLNHHWSIWKPKLICLTL